MLTDALLEHQGSGNQSFARAHEAGELEATPRAAYAKLGRLPVPLSVGWFGEMAAAVNELFPSGVAFPPEIEPIDVRGSYPGEARKGFSEDEEDA